MNALRNNPMWPERKRSPVWRHARALGNGKPIAPSGAAPAQNTYGTRAL